MKITVYCLKGSAGKTPIAVNIALERGYALGTNEPYNLLDKLIPKERFVSIEPSEAFPDLPPEVDIVFDLAGMMSREGHKSIISAVKQSDVVLVPIYNELKCINAGIHTIRELQEQGATVVVVATKLQKQSGEKFTDWRDSRDFQNIKLVLDEVLGDNIPVLPLKFSKVFDTIFEKEASINQIMASDGLARYTYAEIAQQFDDLLSYLEKNYA